MEAEEAAKSVDRNKKIAGKLRV